MPEPIAVRPAPALQPALPPPNQGRGPLAALMWGFRRELLWVLAFSAFVNLLQLTPTVYMLQLFDRVMGSGNEFTLLTMTLLLLVFVAMLAFAEWVRSQLLVRAGNRLDDALGARVFRAAFQAELRQPQRSPQQPLTDVATLRQFFTGSGMFAFADTPWSLLFIAALFLMHPWFGWLAIALCIVQVVVALVARRLMQRAQAQAAQAAGEIAQYLQAKLRRTDELSAMGMLPAITAHWQARSAEVARLQDRQHQLGVRLQTFTKWLQYTQQALMLALGALLAIRGESTVGSMIASNALIGNAVRPLGLLVNVWPQASEAALAWQRLDAVLAQDRGVDGQTAATLRGQVTLEGVSVRVPGRERPILDNVSADFLAGEVVGIVGPSGAGKSTLVRCLLGIWPGAEGRVRVDGCPLEDWDRRTLGEQIGYLPQDVELFDGTIAENIARFGAVDDADVVLAAKAAGIHEMVLALPQGYDTPIGPSGAVLSGGQRQRVALARALVTRPRIVVLDEPNANLDDAGDAALAKAISALRERGITVFMIVHRQQLLALADRLLIMEHGRIASLVAVPKPIARPATPEPGAAAAVAAVPPTAAAASGANPDTTRDSA